MHYSNKTYLKIPYKQYEHLNYLYKFILVTILVATTIIEITRLYLGYLGNLGEKVPELAGFWLLTVLLQLPMQGFLLFNEDLVILPMERAANILMVIVVLLELVVGFIALRKITRHQAKKFHLHQLNYNLISSIDYFCWWSSNVREMWDLNSIH